jgi:2-polyprenyl-3-methyl-5-hydroxy-6-metoxy-1,4-benzoquinol methylase
LADECETVLRGCETLLDLGCGKGNNSPLPRLSLRHSVGVEIDSEALEVNRERRIHSQYIHASVLDVSFADRSFDAVLCMEVVEHLETDEAIRLIERMERWARRVVVISTPNGFMTQDDFDGNPHQHHKSGYDTRFFRDRGYRVYGRRGLKIIPTRYSAKKQVSLLCRALTKLTQYGTYFLPQLSTQLMAVKILPESG